MRAVIQRVTGSTVKINGRIKSKTGPGLLVLLGVAGEDSEEDARYLADKVAHLRIFPDDKGKMNLSLLDVEGEAMVVSQFTLYGDCRKGRRPSFTAAAPPEKGRQLYQRFTQHLAGLGVKVGTGEFGAHMLVELTNDGPVTLLLDSK